jgi:hypoxanthine phosphoribosyltransferase
MPEPPEYQAAIAEVLLTEDQIRAKVAELAAVLSREYQGRRLVLVGVLNGAAVFVADLLRRLAVPAELDFVAVSSYGRSTVSCGEVQLTKDIGCNLQGKDVVVVEDIVDTGRTLSFLVECLRAKGPTSVRVCALLDKPSRREVDFQPDFVGFEIPDRFVVGYGLDFALEYRGLPYVAVLKPEAYASAGCPSEP